MKPFADESMKRTVPTCENSNHDSGVRTPDTSQQLGKYIVNGLEMLSLSDMRIVVDGHGGVLSDAASEDDGLSDIGNISVGSNGKEDCVYLSSIYKTYLRLSDKIDMLLRRECFDRTFVKGVLEDVCSGDLHGARNRICREMRERDPSFPVDLYCVARRRAEGSGPDVSMVVAEALRDLKDIEEMGSRLRRMFFDMRSRSFEAEVEHSRASGELLRQLDGCSRELSDARRVNDLVAKGIRDIAEDFGVEVDGERGIQGHPKMLRSVFKGVWQRIKALEKENQELRARAEVQEDVAESYQELKARMSKIMGENAAFSEAVSKLSTKNARMKREWGALRDMAKKMAESCKKKSATIDRQRKIIDILQSRAGGEHMLPVSELQAKIEEIKTRIDSEQDPLRRERLAEEVLDYERRMSDFLSLLRKEE